LAKLDGKMSGAVMNKTALARAKAAMIEEPMPRGVIPASGTAAAPTSSSDFGFVATTSDFARTNSS
jgi:hypothetical protein